ncbi:aftiphilin-like [Stegostoma tigrinum]|uniref:aftiphilin-like n=1 Tax=Stegostoma tigrinum TaxID=3053191 RepID=UPI00287028E6|nr:aftiphilin-like [Stegostoma tigrinum]XP_059504289.1 aftiphilin-like [Stegostoma tigrinum]
MEPDVIRMYSSSPPPLDDGTEIDDEFGEFGGFSGVGSSTLGYSDFDLEDHHENFMPQNHFVPGHEYSSHADGFADFHSASASDGKVFLSDLSRPTEEMLNDMTISTDKDVIRSKSSVNVFGCTVTEQRMESIKLTDVTARFGNLAKDAHAIGFESEEYCNSKKANPEILTNGYSTKDITQSQGIENIVNKSGQNEQKATNAHISNLWSESMPGQMEDFTEFSAFSNIKEPVELAGETTSPTLSLISKMPLKGDHNTGNHSVIRELPDVQVSPNFAVDGDNLEVTSNRNGTNADLEHTQCQSSEPSTSADTSFPNHDWNTSESMEHIATQNQNAQQPVPEFLETLKETINVESSEIQLSTDQSGSVKQTGAEVDLEICTLNEEGIGVFSDNVPHRIGTIEQGHAVSGEPVATDRKRTEGIESDQCGISSDSLRDGDFASFSLEVNSAAVDDVGTDNERCINSDSKTSSNLATEEFATFQETDVKDEFGVFGSMGTDSLQTYANFSESPAEKNVQTELTVYHEGDLESGEHGTTTTITKSDDEDFGEFGSIQEANTESEFAGFKSDDFTPGEQDTEWNAFGYSVAESTSWATFDEEESRGAVKEEISQCSRTEVALSSDKQLTGWADSTPAQHIGEEPQSQVSLLKRLERVFQTCFSPVPTIKVTKEEICSLGQLLQSGLERGDQVKANNGELLSVWTELQDVEDAHGLRYQWGGSHSNKKLLISLGIDTRNILFTGQRKQPVIVPAYASGLGMLEPTKEPVKPISAAEKIASIGQISTASVTPSEMCGSASDQIQEHVPPVQFDWSSSGLTNPLDANGGSTILNLDFFGPLDDSSSNNSDIIPGVDPELYELTTCKLENTGTINRVTDAFARLMLTAEKTSTSTRKQKKEEVLSKEAAKVIASLPDLSFMHAKVLMFPTTLTPLVSSHTD